MEQAESSLMNRREFRGWHWNRHSFIAVLTYIYLPFTLVTDFTLTVSTTNIEKAKNNILNIDYSTVF